MAGVKKSVGRMPLTANARCLVELDEDVDFLASFSSTHVLSRKDKEMLKTWLMGLVVCTALTANLAAQASGASVYSASTNGSQADVRVEVNVNQGDTVSVEALEFNTDGQPEAINEQFTSYSLPTYTVPKPAGATKVRVLYKVNGGNLTASAWFTITLPPHQ